MLGRHFCLRPQATFLSPVVLPKHEHRMSGEPGHTAAYLRDNVGFRIELCKPCWNPIPHT